jgi:hypothetical protein
MYLWTSDGLGQVPVRYGPFAGTLGEPPLPPKIQKFLARAKKNPQNYEALLLTIIFHEEPWSSDHLMRLIDETFTEGTDPFEAAKAIQGKVIQALEDVYKKHLRDTRFGQLVKKEKQLIAVVSKPFLQHIKELETKGWLEGFLIDALLAESPRGLIVEAGRPFVLYQLPDKIAEQILNSRVPETHYARLGKALLLMAEQRQNDNPAFKERVEKERKKRGQ